MKPDYIFWTALAAFSFHTLEEYSYDWKTWAQKVMKLDMDWTIFYVSRATMLFFGIACASVGWGHPTFALTFPAMLIANALIYNVIPYVRSKRKFAPGMFTGIFLFLPIGFGAYHMAADLGVQMKSLLISGGCGILVTAFPFFLLKTKNIDFFKP